MSRPAGTYAIFDTSEGTILCRLFEKDAPKTVANFVELARQARVDTSLHAKEIQRPPL